MGMDVHAHWEGLFRSTPPEAFSWFRPHLDISLDLIEHAAPDRSSAIIDVGAGESTLVDDLIERGYRNITVLDISETALELTQKRLGTAAQYVQWVAADITQPGILPPIHYDVWHDRAVFHFLTEEKQRAAYVQNVLASVKRGGHVIVGTFGPEGPTKCSGLDVVRYDAKSLHDQFGSRSRFVESRTELHTTPFGTKQQFLYCYCKVE